MVAVSDPKHRKYGASRGVISTNESESPLVNQRAA